MSGSQLKQLGASCSAFYQQYRLFITRHQRWVLAAIAGYLVAIFAAMIIANVSITPDQIVLILFVPAILLGEGFRFLRDWLPFLILILAY